MSNMSIAVEDLRVVFHLNPEHPSVNLFLTLPEEKQIEALAQVAANALDLVNERGSWCVMDVVEVDSL